MGAQAGEPVAGAASQRSGTIEDWPESPARHLGASCSPWPSDAGQNYMLHWLEEQYPTRLDRTAHSPSAGSGGPGGRS